MQKTKNDILLKLAGYILTPAILLLIWQLTASIYNKPYMYPTFTAVLKQLTNPCQDHYTLGSLMSNTAISLLRVATGFIIAAIVGISVGLALGTSKILCRLFEPVIEIIRPLCPIAWMPFAIAIFKLKTIPNMIGMGYTNTVFDQVQLSMIFILFMGGFFPIMTNTLDGVIGVRKNYLILAQALGANRRQQFFHVYLPAAMPMILTGLRQGLGLCWFVIIAAEMTIGADSGIGYMLIYAADLSDMDIVVAAMMIIGTIGATLNFAMRSAMQTFVSWHGKEV
ncbi:MAG: ABC transporter permease [Phycisphaerae bacterium]|nr:ABC transporter permease [Phycisphaerae bacterium]